jgi:hypothetical protein
VLRRCIELGSPDLEGIPPYTDEEILNAAMALGFPI